MSLVPDEHMLAHKAVLRVQSILADIGALSGSIEKDYGEDLFVQSRLNGVADNFNILIQIKGRSKLVMKKEVPSIQIKTDSLLRWISHAHPVLVCIYDNDTGNIYCFQPSQMFSMWDLSTTNARSKIISLHAGMKFSPETAKRIVWDCRISHYSRMLMEMNYIIDEQHRTKVSSRKINKSSRERSLLLLTFLKLFEIVSDDGFTKSFCRSITGAAKHLNKKPKLSLDEAITLILLVRIEKFTGGCGVTSILLDHIGYFAREYFRVAHVDMWEDVMTSLALTGSSVLRAQMSEDD